MKDILLINKPRCLTPLQTITLLKNRFAHIRHETISYAGRLDPMADGLLVLLVGEANKQRSHYEDLRKTYHFSFLLGITTDTYDVLGRVASVSSYDHDQTATLPEIISRFKGKRTQSYPPYSSMTVHGKPLFFWARENRLHEIVIPKKDITVSELELLSCERVSTKDTTTQIITDIKKVIGDFRQDDIIHDWQTLSFPFTLTKITCRAVVSSGTYIRSLVHDIGQQLGVGAVTFHITREALGDYQLKDALTITS